jgi:hypothetical protein
LDICLKCIELLPAQVVISDCEDRFYEGAFQGFTDLARFNESCVSIDSKGTCHEIKFFFVFHWDWPLFRFRCTSQGFGQCSRQLSIASRRLVLYPLCVLPRYLD